ncbi:uncharacterized protein [Mytilus edulis]|uniref:uncharacterized protein n=1 Tax=Mytilus edulis TaxID=6550 RepID=UPI0039F0800D
MALQQNSCNTICTGNTISIEWQGQQEKPEQINKYIVKYRAKDSKDEFALERTSESKIQMSNLRSETFYEIKIYVEDSNGDESELLKTEVKTLPSVASKLLKSADRICDDSDVYRLSPVKITNPSNGIQIREFLSDVNSKDERFILLLGASGSGKSTLVDAIINHVTDVSFADNFRFKITDEKKQEKEDIVCYKIRYQKGFNVGFNLNIIDVPGFESGYNESIYQQLSALFQSVQYISAACLVVPSICRLTEEYRCIFNNILSIFEKDITYVIPLLTFDDGGEITALTSMKDAKVPFEDHMTLRFNNSQLFNGKEQLENWVGRRKTMQLLLDKLKDSVNCSAEKTIEVLESRIKLEKSSEDIKTLKRLIEQTENNLKENGMTKSSMTQHVKQNGKPSKNERDTSKNRPTIKDETDCKNKDTDETLLKENRAFTHAIAAILEISSRHVECIKTTALLCDVPKEFEQ